MARRRKEQLTLNAEINVVSLIDVMMLLLVIFMITAPMMQGGVDVTLPEADAKPLETNSGLVVTIDRNGAIFVDQTRMTMGQFRGAFKALADRRAKDGVYLAADSTVPYGIFIKVLGIMRAAGVENIGMPVVPEPER